MDLDRLIERIMIIGKAQYPESEVNLAVTIAAENLMHLEETRDWFLTGKRIPTIDDIEMALSNFFIARNFRTAGFFDDSDTRTPHTEHNDDIDPEIEEQWNALVEQSERNSRSNRELFPELSAIGLIARAMKSVFDEEVITAIRSIPDTDLQAPGEAAIPTRPSIVSSIMKKASDFRDRNKVRELAKKLDQANMPLPIRRGPPGKWEPQTYSEVAEKPTSFEYNRIFGSRNGVLVGDLYK